MRLKTTALIILAIAIAGGGAFAIMRKSALPAAAAAPAPVPVVAGKVTSQDVPIYLRGIGTVIAYNTDIVRSQIQGQLTRIAFTEGQTVRTGDLLAQIDPRPYQAQLDQMTATRDRDQAQLTNALANLKRYTQLAAKGYATPQLVETQKAQVAQLQSAVKSDEALIEQAQVQLGYTELTSPISGITGVRQVDVGNIIHPTDAEWSGRCHPDRADIADLHASRDRSAEDPAADGQQRQAADGPCLQPGRQDQARRGQAQSHQQRDPADDRRSSDQGRVSQHLPSALAGRTGERATAPGNEAQRIDSSGRASSSKARMASTPT